MELNPKTLAGRAEVPPIVLPSEVVEHADRVAHVCASCIGAEEIADDNFVVAVDLKAGGRVEAEDVGGAGGASADRVACALETHADGTLPRFAPAAFVPIKFPSTVVVGRSRAGDLHALPRC